MAPVADRALDALVAGIAVEPDEVMALAGALSLGEPDDEVERLEREAAERVWTEERRDAVAAALAARRADPLADATALAAAEAELEPAPPANRAARRLARTAALGLLVQDPAMREHFASLEEYLAGEEEERFAELALPLAGEAAMPAAAIDLGRALHEAGLYVDSYPKPDLAVGLLPELVTEWLAARMAMTEDPDAARPRMRRAVAAFADAAAREFPLSSRALHAALEQPAPADATQDPLWLAFAGRIAARKLVDVGW